MLKLLQEFLKETLEMMDKIREMLEKPLKEMLEMIQTAKRNAKDNKRIGERNTGNTNDARRVAWRNDARNADRAARKNAWERFTQKSAIVFWILYETIYEMILYDVGKKLKMRY